MCFCNGSNIHFIHLADNVLEKNMELATGVLKILAVFLVLHHMNSMKWKY